MRNLIVTRGLPGSGKSHTLAELGLTDFTLSADTMRFQFASPVLLPDGRMSMSHEMEEKIWSQMFEILSHRMARGETTVMDATHPTAGEFKRYLELAAKYRYRIACLDFSEVPADVSNWLNDGRSEYRVVPPAAIARITERMAAGQVPSGVDRIMVRSNKSHLFEMKDWLKVPVLDPIEMGFDRVMLVGDIQGCNTALQTLIGSEIRDDTFYIFAGDACDRGEENGDVMRFLIDHAMGKPNVRFLHGNHEDHLDRYAQGAPPVSSEFAQRTLPQLVASGVTPDELNAFCENLSDIVMYRVGRQNVMVTHGGLPTVPGQPWMVSARQCIYGTGHYEDDVDTQFERNAPDGWFQVHGHRNHHDRPIQATPHSFNLEASVEDGGQMRGLVHDRHGFHPIEVNNPVFRPFRQRRHHRMTIVPPWITRDTEGGTVMSPELQAAMKAHPEVRFKSSETFPHVVSLNFSKQVFYDKSWDDVTVKARGMFIDAESGEIVSRFRDKFWTIGERADVSLDALKDKLQFPLTLWVKENGFLGLVGYDKRTDKMFPSSKSMAEGPFAEWFKEILNETIPSEGKQDALRRFLRDTESAMAFEVIDPERDPHITEYDGRKLVLLDVVRRSTDIEALPYEDLERVGKQFGFEVKQRAMTFKDWRAFDGWYRKASQDMNRKLEGYVVEDASGYQVKMKLPWYAFWKLCRGMKDAIVREREGGKPARALDPQFLESRNLAFTVPLAKDFFEWCKTQDTDFLKGSSIIQLRNSFENPELNAQPSMKM